MNTREEYLEAALLEYIVRYGPTEKAKRAIGMELNVSGDERAEAARCGLVKPKDKSQ